MAYRAFQWLGGKREGPIASDVGTSATPHEIAGLRMIASEECAPSVKWVALRDHWRTRFSGEQKPKYKSMTQSKSEFSLDVAQEIEHSKAHWSELSGYGDGDDDMSEEDVRRENFQGFEELKNDLQWMHPEKGHFFKCCLPSQDLGKKIAEGGQAEIMESLDSAGVVDDEFLLKVFKKGTQISQLRQQWPSRVLQREVWQIVHAGFIVEDGRFAFAMSKCWGDLRKLIDQGMQAKNNRGRNPPFPLHWNGIIMYAGDKGVTMHARDIMEDIAKYMCVLHKKDIVHRDLKASNILLHKDLEYPHLMVADFECSIGVVGTGFWRAPEILLGLKNGTIIDYNKKVDVYAYGMTCFEIVTGLLPFQGELEPCPASYDLVIEGRRPNLPRSLDEGFKRVIERCWDSNPLERPTFEEIFIALYHMY